MLSFFIRNECLDVIWSILWERFEAKDCYRWRRLWQPSFTSFCIWLWSRITFVVDFKTSVTKYSPCQVLTQTYDPYRLLCLRHSQIKEPTLSLFFCLKPNENSYISGMLIYVTSVSRPLKERWMSFIQSSRNRIPLSICWPINFVGYRWLTVSSSNSNIVRVLPPKTSAAASNKGLVCSHNAKRQKIISRHVMTFECGTSALDSSNEATWKVVILYSEN